VKALTTRSMTALAVSSTVFLALYLTLPMSAPDWVTAGALTGLLASLALLIGFVVGKRAPSRRLRVIWLLFVVLVVIVFALLALVLPAI